MLSLPPPSEWDVHWLHRLASLDDEQYRHYAAKFCRDVFMLHQQANGEQSGRTLAAVRLQLVSGCTRASNGKARP